MNLDDMLTTEQAAKWLGMSEEKLLAHSSGHRPVIPAFWLNARVVRFHPRTIITKLARDAGLGPELIAAALNMNSPQ